MRQGKKPTRKQKELLSYYGLNSDNWLVIKDTSESLTIVDKIIGKQIRELPKVREIA